MQRGAKSPTSLDEPMESRYHYPEFPLLWVDRWKVCGARVLRSTCIVRVDLLRVHCNNVAIAESDVRGLKGESVGCLRMRRVLGRSWYRSEVGQKRKEEGGRRSRPRLSVHCDWSTSHPHQLELRYESLILRCIQALALIPTDPYEP